MHALLLAAVLGVLPPPPTGAELAAAEADVREVFADQFRAADTDRERVDLARRLIETAAESRPAAKYALLVQARELAIAAGDSTVAIRAVEGLVDGFGPEKRQDAAGWAADGHREWNAAGDRRPADRLRGRLEAAECYLRALPDLAGFQRAAVEGRLKQLGYEPHVFAFEFDRSVEDWKACKHIAELGAKEGLLVGRVTGGDPFLTCEGLEIAGSECSTIEIRMAVTAGGRAEFFWSDKEPPLWVAETKTVFQIRGDGEFHTYRIDVARLPGWKPRISALRFDPADWDSRGPRKDSFSVDYIRGLR